MQEGNKNNIMTPEVQLEEEQSKKKRIPKVDVSNLTAGMVVKNYKKMCNLLGDEVKVGGSSKQAQLGDWRCYFDWERSGQKYIITTIYEVPLEKEDKRKFGNNRGHYFECESYKVNKDLSMRKGVYKIQQGMNIYIGSTIESFRGRFRKHYEMGTCMPYTREMLLNGGEYSVLWVAPENATESEIRRKEQFFIREYARNNEYHLVNRQKYTVILGGRKRKSRKPVDKNPMKSILRKVKKMPLRKGMLNELKRKLRFNYFE